MITEETNRRSGISAISMGVLLAISSFVAIYSTYTMKKLSIVETTLQYNLHPM